MATTRSTTSTDTTVQPTTTTDTTTDTSTDAPKPRTLEQRAKDGDLLPSDYESIGRQYGLTRPETERLVNEGTLSDDAADKIRSDRVVYRFAVDQVHNPPTVAAPLAVSRGSSEADRKAEEEAKRARDEARAAANAPTLDKTQPEAGPYGPFATYGQTSVGALEVAEQTDLTVEQAKEQQGQTESGS